eukprot:evm.model.scf_138.8 EVM.evm.TU.scf_138.8   scf_138:122558-128659(+)
MAALRCIAWVVAALLMVPHAHCRVEDEPVTLRPAMDGMEPQLHGAMCRVCNILVDIVEDAFGDQRLVNWLIKVVENHVCPHLPKRFQEECTEYAPMYVPTVVRWIEEIASTALCMEVGVCESAILDNVAADMGRIDDYDCIVCKNLTSIVDMESGGVQADTLIGRIDQLKEQCKTIDEEDAPDRCKELVNKYGYMLVYFIAREEGSNVGKTCSDLGICPKVSRTPVIDPIPESIVRRMLGYWRASNAEDECQQCKDVAQSALTDFATADAKDEVVAYVASPCSWIAQHATQCLHAIGNYSTEVIDAIVAATTAEDVCTYLQHCGDAKGSAVRVGDDPVVVASVV